MHQNFWPWNPEWDVLWFSASFLSLHAMLFAFAPYMPVPWYVLMTGIVIGLGYLVRPDEPAEQLFLWSAAICVLRWFLYFMYIFYFLSPLKADLFPFNFFSDDWKRSQPRWQPINLRAVDSLNSTTLCERCHKLTSESNLIMGSSLLFSRLTEWHDFWTRHDFSTMFTHGTVEDEESQISPAAIPSSCQLCCLLWHSMSPLRQQTISSSIDFNPAVTNASELPKPEDSHAELCVKVWEERPLSHYTFMQLFWGDIDVGA
ncbi:hypothetical protein DL765_000392 [Monosporascus sp. GIB2]|nr:hypothetical protein DL765_000392 [Monosporascus sp. GIB2]